MKKKLKKYIKSLKRNSLMFIKYNRQFLSYIFLALISCVLVRKMTINDGINLKAFFFDFSVIVLLGSLCYFYKPRKQYKYLKWILILITIINFINVIYYAFFQSFVSVALLGTLGQTGEVTGAIFEKLKWYNFIFILFPLAFYYINKRLKLKDYFSVVEKIESSRRLLINIAILGGICLSINIATLKGQDISRFTKQWNREYIVERFGIVIYQFNDVYQTIRSSLSSIFGYERAALNFEEFYEENQIKKSNNQYTNQLKDYNVVVIHMESIMNFLIGLEINGVEITPNLNKLVKETMYFDNFYAQVSVGTSSDTEFTLNTSLMPVQSGTVFVNYANRNYVSLEKLLNDENYYTFSMHGNKASMWNRNNMHPNLGYERFYSETDYELDEIVGLGLSDASFFRQSEEMIKEIDDMVKSSDKYDNWMGTLIMLSNHTPFDDPIYLDEDTKLDLRYHTGEYQNGEEITFEYLDREDIKILGNYFRSVHYADQELGKFIDYVKTHDEYNNTLFVLYGDHAAQISKNVFNKYFNFDTLTGETKTDDDETKIDFDYYAYEMNKKVPLILFTKDNKLKGKISYPMGMIDILPTIGNMLGIYNKYALGHDIFEVKNDNMIVFPNGNFITDKVFYYNAKNDYKILSTEQITLGETYIDEKKQLTEEILKVSNDIIVYDLIEKASDRIEVIDNGEKN